MAENSFSDPAAASSRESPLVDAAWTQFATVVSASGTAPASPVRIHAAPLEFPGYQLLGELHRGGQGVVYLAIQESTHRKVAIKVLRNGPFASPADVARFEREVELLARLKHPGIVAIYDRGVTGGFRPEPHPGNGPERGMGGIRGVGENGAVGGCPFLVMDYVAGRPLDTYVSGAALGTRQIVELFRKICEAVHAAHLVGIIHRDLKPANIRVDDSGEPHVLDFGLAKLTGEDGSGGANPDLTQTGQFIGSLPWASPEQAEGRHDLTDVRTDVYSLGVLLFHMLTGELPYPKSDSPRQLASHISGTAPVRPSSIRRGLSGDIETIILTCLAKEPARRYQSAGEVARDVGNALAGRPIDAKRDSAVYVVRKLVRRHWTAAAVAGAFVALLAGTAVTTSVLYGQSSRARAEAQQRMERAEREALKAAKVGEILGELLTSMSPWEWAGANNARVLEALLDQASARAAAELADEPEVLAALDNVLGSGYYALNNYFRAEEHLERCLELRLAMLGEQHAQVASVRTQLAALRYSQGRHAEAESLASQALEWQVPTLGEANAETAATLSLLAEMRLHAGDFASAEELGRRALAAIIAVHGKDHPRLSSVYRMLGTLLRASGRLDEAEPMLVEALRVATEALPADHPLIAGAHMDLGTLFTVRLQLAKGESHLREALRIRRATFDGPHEETAITLTNLSAVQVQRGEFDEGAALAREAIEMFRAVDTLDRGHTVNALGNLAGALQGLGKPGEAAAAHEEALALSRGHSEPGTANILSNLAQLRKTTGDLEAADTLEREALEIRRRLYGDAHIEVAHSLANLGHTQLKRNDPAAAEPLLRDAEKTYRAILGDDHVLVGSTMGHLGRCLLAQHTGGAEAAEALAQSVRLLSAVLAQSHPRLAQDRCDLAEALIRERRFDDAEATLLECEQALADAPDAAASVATLSRTFVRLYDSWGKPESAATWRARLPADTPPR